MDPSGRKYTDEKDLATSHLVNLASSDLGAKVLFATDEWFAVAGNMLKPSTPSFDPDAFCAQGKVMDGWESRRRRTPGNDWAVFELGSPGTVHVVEADTMWFTGNQVPAVSVYFASIPSNDALGLAPRSDLGTQGTKSSDEQIVAAAKACDGQVWHEAVPLSPLRPGYEGQSVHKFAVPASLANKRVTHCRVNQHPDGGLSRLRLWGRVAVDFDRDIKGRAGIDLVSVGAGGRGLGASNMHYGEPQNLVKPGRGINMGDGWETARNPKRPSVIRRDEATGLVDMPGVCDWAVLRLGVVAENIESVVIDTHHFKGNYPESALVEAVCMPEATDEAIMALGDAAWQPLVKRTKLGPDAEHVFDASSGHLSKIAGVTHLRLVMYPDGGIMRLRVRGTARCPFPVVEAETSAKRLKSNL